MSPATGSSLPGPYQPAPLGAPGQAATYGAPGQPVAYGATAFGAPGQTTPPMAPGYGPLSSYSQPGVMPSYFSPPVGSVPVRKRSRKKLLVIGGPILVLLIVAGILVPLLSNSGPSYPAKWDPRVSDIVQFVEQNRGLTFKHPVNAEFLNDAQFDKVTAVNPSASDNQELADLAADLATQLGPDVGELTQSSLSDQQTQEIESLSASDAETCGVGSLNGST